MLDLEERMRRIWPEILAAIPSGDVYPEEGVEDRPHVTALYGFLPGVTVDSLDEVEINPVELKLTGISCFTSNPLYDVLKYDVYSPELVALNRRLKELPTAPVQFPYSPHMTIAYLRKGTGRRFERKLSRPVEMSSDTFRFSTADKQETKFRV